MFENLSDKLQRVFKNLRGEGKLTTENMDVLSEDSENVPTCWWPRRRKSARALMAIRAS